MSDVSLSEDEGASPLFLHLGSTLDDSKGTVHTSAYHDEQQISGNLGPGRLHVWRVRLSLFFFFFFLVPIFSPPHIVSPTPSPTFLLLEYLVLYFSAVCCSLLFHHHQPIGISALIPYTHDSPLFVGFNLSGTRQCKQNLPFLFFSHPNNFC